MLAHLIYTGNLPLGSFGQNFNAIFDKTASTLPIKPD